MKYPVFCDIKHKNYTLFTTFRLDRHMTYNKGILRSIAEIAN